MRQYELMVILDPELDDRTVAPSLNDGRGVGMFGMYERINLLGGSLNVDSTPNVGTEIRIEVPLDPASPLEPPREE